MLAQALSGVCKLNHYTLACKVYIWGGGDGMGDYGFGGENGVELPRKPPGLR